MKKYLPYMSTPGTLPKILKKICEASVPENFNADFLGTKLGFPSGNQRSFITWAKKCELINSDGTPTQLYKNFRNPDTRDGAMATALKKGYAEAYIRNEYAHDLDKAGFTKLVTEITGSPHDNTTVKVIVRSFFHAKEFANFEIQTDEPTDEENSPEQENELQPQNINKISDKFNFGLKYTINLVLPKTDDPSIYNAIFKSLKENLLND